jgi:hypothetical protein
MGGACCGKGELKNRQKKNEEKYKDTTPAGGLKGPTTDTQVKDMQKPSTEEKVNNKDSANNKPENIAASSLNNANAVPRGSTQIDNKLESVNNKDSSENKLLGHVTNMPLAASQGNIKAPKATTDRVSNPFEDLPFPPASKVAQPLSKNSLIRKESKPEDNSIQNELGSFSRDLDELNNQNPNNSISLRLPSDMDLNGKSLAAESFKNGGDQNQGDDMDDDQNLLADLNFGFKKGETRFAEQQDQQMTSPNSHMFYHKYQAECLAKLSENQHQFLRYHELLTVNLEQGVPNSPEEWLLDTGYQSDSIVSIKNNCIRKANNYINKLLMPPWEPFRHTASEEIAKTAANYVDPDYQFDQATLAAQSLRAVRIRDHPNPIIYHEETMAEGMIFSDRNLTPISSALACLIHFDNTLKTKLVKNLIYPQNVGLLLNSRMLVLILARMDCTMSRFILTDAVDLCRLMIACLTKEEKLE